MKNLHRDEMEIPIIIPKTRTMLDQIVKSIGLMAVHAPVIMVSPQPYKKGRKSSYFQIVSLFNGFAQNLPSWPKSIPNIGRAHLHPLRLKSTDVPSCPMKNNDNPDKC